MSISELTSTKNPNESDLLTSQQRFLVSSGAEISAKWPELGLALYHHVNRLGQPMMFARPGRQWAIPIYKDQAHHIVIRKCVQCGISEWLIIKVLRFTREGKHVLYVLPTETARNDFVNNRIDPLLQNVDMYRRAAMSTDNVGLKLLFNGSVKFVGSLRKSAFREYPAQVLIKDEKDLCDLKNLEYAVDRLAATYSLTGKEPYNYDISNPSISGYGIDDDYEKSNKQQWFVKCDACNTKQPIDWFVNIVEQTGDNKYSPFSCVPCDDGGGDMPVLCRHCKKPLERLGPGEWVVEFRDRDVSGYHVSKLFTDQTTIRQLYQIFTESLSNQSKLQRFYNSDLGLPYTGHGDKFDYDTLARCAQDYLPLASAQGTVAGMDVGKVCHLEISQLLKGRIRVIAIMTVPLDIAEVIRVFKKFGVMTYVVDAMPETLFARTLIEKYRGGFMCWYGGEKAGHTQPDYRSREITVNRTESLDEMVAAYIDGLFELPTNWATIDDGQFLQQMTAPTRLEKEQMVNGIKKVVYVWDEGNKPDHYFHSSNYLYLAAKRRGFTSKPFGGLWTEA